MTENYQDKLVFQVTNEEVILPEPETDKISFQVSGKQYLRYIRWKRKIEERIAMQELETGKRFFDGEKLSQNQLSKLRKQLETGKIEELRNRNPIDNLISADNSEEQTELLLSGLVENYNGYLRVKNPIYRSVFTPQWVSRQLENLLFS